MAKDIGYIKTEKMKILVQINKIYNNCLDCHMFMATKFHNFNSEQSINNWFNGLCVDMFDGKMKIERVKDGTTITETIDCTNEWNRYCATHEPKTYRNVF